MEAATTEPAIRAGKLPEDFCPSDWQEVLDTFTSRMDIPVATGQRGADGQNGITIVEGDTGDGTSATGDAPITAATLNIQTAFIPAAAQYVDWYPPDSVNERSSFNFKLSTAEDPLESASGSAAILPAISLINNYWTGGGDTSLSDSALSATPIRIWLTKPTLEEIVVTITWTEYTQEADLET